MPKTYLQWTPDQLANPDEQTIDPLSEQVADREDERVLADPEIESKGETIRVFNAAPEPVPAVVDHYAVDPTAAGTVDRVEQRGHLDAPPPSADRYSDDMLDRVEGIAHHKGVLRRHDANGRERFSIRFLEDGQKITMPVDARDLEAADEALEEALMVPGREPIR